MTTPIADPPAPPTGEPFAVSPPSNPAWGPPPTQPPGNGLAVAGFVLGLVALLLLVFTIGILSPLTLVMGIAGSVLALVGKRRVDRGVTVRGRGLAVGGLVLGPIASVLSIMAVALYTVGIMAGGAGDSRDIAGAESTVQSYLDALVQGNGDDACELLEAGPRNQLASGPGSRQFGTVGSCEDFVDAQAAAIDRSPGGSLVYDGAELTRTDSDVDLRTSIDLTRGLATVRGQDGQEPIRLRHDTSDGWRIVALPGG